ncbi:hypothetical protein [Xanthomonas phage JGB6]|nr:hypothetical protein [Xanthomonas phage JGB6]
MKAQRLKITENGMTTYSDYYCGIKFTDGLSDEPVSAADATRIGSFIRCEAIDDGRQTGLSNDLLDLNTAKAEVVIRWQKARQIRFRQNKSHLLLQAQNAIHVSRWKASLTRWVSRVCAASRKAMALRAEHRRIDQRNPQGTRLI